MPPIPEKRKTKKEKNVYHMRGRFDISKWSIANKHLSIQFNTSN